MSSVIVSLLSSFDDKGIKDAEKSFAGLKSKVASIGKSLAITAGSYLAGAQTVNFIKDSVDAAAVLRQNMTGLETIFGKSTQTIMGFVQQSNQMGMSMADSARAATFMGSVFKQTGMPMDQVVEKTKAMVSLGADLAATYGYSVDEALTAMTATFRGEYDPIEKFGVAMKQSQVNAELAARGLTGLKGAALIAAQQQVRYEMILQRTADAQGAFQRSTGNLVVQMAILKATFTNMQATLGSQLTPVMTQFVVKLQPLLEQMMPHLVKLFQSIGVVLLNLLPVLPIVADGLAKLFDILGAIMAMGAKPIANLVAGIVAGIPAILTFMALFKGITLFGPPLLTFISTWQNLAQAIGAAGAAEIMFNTAAAATPWGAIAAGIAMVGGAIVALANGVQNYQNVVSGVDKLSAKAKAQAYAYANAAGMAAQQGSYIPGSVDKNQLYDTAYKKALVDWYTRYKAKQSGATSAQMAQDWKKIQKQINDMMNGGQATTTSKTKSWFESFADELTKQADRLKLKNLGLTDALIDSMLNAADWKAAVAKVLGMTANELKAFQNNWLNTAAGTAEAEKTLTENTNKFVDAVKKRIDTIKSLTDGLGSFMPKTLAEVTAQVGQFESATVSAAESLRNSLKDALDNKGITDAAYTTLMTYANREIKVMQDLAAQRDRVAAKIEAAKQVYTEVAQAVRGYGNITASSTQQVTESYKKIIDGVEVTVSKTVDAIQNKDLVASYKQVVDKTKAFLANLQQLKKMGLNQTLFKQIIDAGVDAGNATAEAIVQGGGDTVSSLNDLFGQLDVTGAQMADLTAQVMEDSGIKIVSGFIDGLTAQEADLAAKAKSMAQIFSDAFNNNVRFVMPTIKPSDYGLTDKQAADALKGAGLSPDQGGAGKNDFGTTVADVTKVITDVTKTVTDVAYVAKGELDRVERAAAGIGNLAGIDTTALAPSGPDRVERMAAAYAAANPTYNVTVNAGMGTDGTSVGQTIVQLLKQYERNNGAVWTAAS
jgi:hypothetical protein